MLFELSYSLEREVRGLCLHESVCEGDGVSILCSLCLNVVNNQLSIATCKNPMDLLPNAFCLKPLSDRTVYICKEWLL